MTAALLALAIAATPPLAQEEWGGPDEQDEGGHRLSIAAWGGDALDQAHAGRSYGHAGGEVAWSFDQLDLGVAAFGYHHLSATRAWTPVTLVRLVQRFQMRSGVEATFGLGVGAAKPSGWEAWFQVGLGARVYLGPMFLGGELAFERGDLLKLAAGLGLTF